MHHTQMKTGVLSACLLMLFCAPALRANMIWDWSYTGNQWRGSGELITDSTLTTGTLITGYQILSMSGVWAGDSIDELLPPLSFLSNDNLLSLSTPQLSGSGLAFSHPDFLYNIAWSGSGNFYKASRPGFSDDGLGSFSATLASPEPAPSVLLGTTLLGLALFLLHRNATRPRLRQ